MDNKHCRIRICEILRGAFSFEADKPEGAKSHLLQILLEQIHCKYASLWTHHPATDTLHLGATSTHPEIINSAVLPTNTPAGDGLKSESGFAYIPDISKDARYRDRKLIDKFELTHMYSFRLGASAQNIHGVVCLYPSDAMSQMETEEFRDICKVAYLPVKLAIDRLRIKIVNSISYLVSQKDDVGSFLYKALQIICSRLSMEGATVFLWDAGNERFRLAKSFYPKPDIDIRKIRYTQRDPFFREIQAGMTILLHGDEAQALHDSVLVSENVFNNRCYTIALVPIKDPLSDGKTIGFLRCVNEKNRIKTNDVDYFSESDRCIFEDCAAVIALGLHYYREKKRIKQMFAFFLHEAGAPIQGIEAQCERMLNPALFGKTEVNYDTHIKDVERYKEVLKELLIQYSVQDVDQLIIHLDDKPVRLLQDILVPCIKAAIYEVKKRKLRTRLDDGKTHSIHYDASEFPHVLDFQVDSIRIRQVFSNLLRNAIKYHNKNKAIFEVGIYYRKTNNGDHGILICDTGMGIRDDIRDKIFDKDFRAPEARRRDVFGTGLGLYLVKTYVEKHGGTVRLITHSEMLKYQIPGNYVTCFVVEFPANTRR